jgi:oligo-1,6-glucosidase
MESQEIAARDNGRTPFQWDSDGDPNSCLNYFKKLVRLRKNTPALVYGKYTLLDTENPDIYAYTREWEGKRILVLLNFKDKAADAKTELDLSSPKVPLGNYPTPPQPGRLRPYEAVVYEW